MKVKVCGMRDPRNIRELSSLKPDYMGFIFYPESKRYVGDIAAGVLSEILSPVKKTGVFVNEPPALIMDLALKYNLDAIQLHGNESAEICGEIKKNDIEVIKAFGVDDTFDFTSLEPYAGKVDYFLFDTKTSGYGGSGRTFNWAVLESYNLNVPYFLSGGLNSLNIEKLSEISDKRFYAADLNSGFEISPGVKNITELEKAFKLLRP